MAHDIRIITETELRRGLFLDLASIDVIEQAFAALARGIVTMPPIVSMELHSRNAEVGAKMAFIEGFDISALKVSTGFYDNPARGIPSLGGMVTAMSAHDGRVAVVFLDNGYLTDLRTAAAGAVAARHLAPPQVTPAVVNKTPATAPLIQPQHLHPGLHITATGAAVPEKTEIAPACLYAADIYVADSAAQVALRSELRAARAAGLWSETDPTELGAIVTGQIPERRSADEITIADLTGTGAQDTAIAAHALAAFPHAGQKITT